LEEKERLLPGFEGEIIHLRFLNLDSAHGQGDLCNHLAEKFSLFLIGISDDTREDIVNLRGQ
jgi:hypothetical protein